MKRINELYELEYELPAKCVQECCTSVDNSKAITKCTEKLALDYYPSNCRSVIRDYGCWTHSELLRKGNKELNEMVLWLAVWNKHDRGE